jgi:hypothetical protein
VCGLVPAICNEVRHEQNSQAESQPFESGREPSLDCRKNGRQERDRGEDEKVRRSE